MKIKQIFHYQVNEEEAIFVMEDGTIDEAKKTAELMHEKTTKNHMEDDLFIYLSYWMDSKKKTNCITILVGYRRLKKWYAIYRATEGIMKAEEVH